MACLLLQRNGSLHTLHDQTVIHPARRAIEARRASFNDAIARRDVDAIASFLLPTYHVVTGRSEQRSTREESHSTWTALFEKDPHVIFVRTPSDILVNDEWGMAHESGEWTGKQFGHDLSGVYAAKWHRDASGEWMLQAEIFTPLSTSPR